jgi:predicted P-loop ATPase/GTPase
MGFYLNFEIEQYRIKEEIKFEIINNLPENELTLVKISSGDNEKITWMDEGREFRYEGNMFDVVKSKKATDTTYYYCFNDIKESKLMARLDKLVKEQTDNSQSRTNQKKQEINYFFYEILSTQSLTEKPFFYFNYPRRYKSIDTDILSPPPRITA